MNRQPTATWTAKQERVALLVAAGRSIKAAAEEAEVGERTAHTWLDDPAYRGLVHYLRSRLLDEAVGRLAGAANAAVATLVELLDDESPTVRLRAATGVLDALLRVREHVELSDRVARLEGVADGSGPGVEGDAA
jgi:HEAT repeat protein